MGYRLQMPAEIYDWLADLRDSDPPAAAVALQALATLAATGHYLGRPLVALVDGRPRPEDLPSALDVRYQTRLESLTGLRRQVAEAATRRKELELLLAKPDWAQDTDLQWRLALAQQEEERRIVASQREQAKLDAFRTRKEILKAALTAAQADQLIDPDGGAAKLDQVTRQVEQAADLEPPAEGLLELRPGAPAENGIRILFAVEPPGTALLLAVLDGVETIRDRYHEAIRLASEALTEARADSDVDLLVDLAQALTAALPPERIP